MTDAATTDQPLALEPRTQFDGAILGWARRFNSEFLVYDERRVLDALVADADPSEEEPELAAREWFDFNILGAWVGEGTPAFLYEPWEQAHRPVELFRVRVAGTPIPQGSKRAWLNQKTHQVQMAEDQGARHASWRREVTAAVKEKMRDAGIVDPIDTPVSVLLTFHLFRGVGMYGTGKNAHELKAAAPGYPARPPDLDKLTRAVFDAVTDARLWVDDAQVTSVTARKRFVDRFGTEPDGVEIVVGLQ